MSCFFWRQLSGRLRTIRSTFTNKTKTKTRFESLIKKVCSRFSNILMFLKVVARSVYADLLNCSNLPQKSATKRVETWRVKGVGTCKTPTFGFVETCIRCWKFPSGGFFREEEGGIISLIYGGHLANGAVQNMIWLQTEICARTPTEWNVVHTVSARIAFLNE